MSNSRGFTLVELIVTVAVAGTLAVTAYLGNDFLVKHRIRSASRDFYATLQTLRQDAMSKSTANTSIGHGLRFNSPTSYTIFEFLDADNDYEYDAGEEAGAGSRKFPDGMVVRIKDGTDLKDPTHADVAAFNPLIFDRRGLTRGATWSSAAGRTYVFEHPIVAQSTCVTISLVRIREGLWDQGATDCVIQ